MVWRSFFTIVLAVSFQYVFSQGLTCETSDPFCTGTIYNFPAGTTGTAQQGAYYGCLLTQPAPAWYHMLIEDPGYIQIYMYSTPLVDIDFICWGPYSDPYQPCVAGLTSNKVVSCSYSPNPTEYCNIPNGQTGEYYILLITNYSQQQCNITFSQTAGVGSTDCTILPPLVGSNSPVCVGETLELYADTIVNATYWWAGPNGFMSTAQNPTIPNAQLLHNGSYSCIITVNSQSSDPAITEVDVNPKPTLGIANDDSTICIGTPGYIIVNLTGWGAFTVDYTDGLGIYTAEGLYGPKDTIFVYPVQPTTYTLTQVADQFCEQVLFGKTIHFDTYPYTSATLSGGGNYCTGEPVNLSFNLTGTPPWSVTYTANDADPQTFTANSSPHTLTLYPSTNTLYEIASVQDINCAGTPSGSASVTIFPAAVVNAGEDQTVFNGSTTTLNGQATGGSGSYSVQWEPTNKVINPNSLTTLTTNLTLTTDFTLTVNDNAGNCVREDVVRVTVEGGALSCNPSAMPPMLCNGFTTTLHANASGGTPSNYSYNWSSDPSGFTSNISDPVVSPTQNTSYFVSIFDGFNTTNGSVQVIVYQLPVPNAGNDKTIAHGTNTTLSGSATSGDGNYIYQWEPADKLSSPPNTKDPVTILLYNSQPFTLTVSDGNGCICADPDVVQVNISGSALSVNPYASKDVICDGETIQLFAAPGGGSGSYDCTWKINNVVISELENPTITPHQSGIYTVQVHDGYNITTGSVAITVNPTPVVYLGPPDTLVCVYDTITLNAGNPGAEYLWSNGATTQTIRIGSTGIGFDIKHFTVDVSTGSGCSAEASINVYFDFSGCFGITEHSHFGTIKIFPNPTDGDFTLELENYQGEFNVEVTDMFGRLIYLSQEENHNGSFKKSINLENIPAGLYTVRIQDNEAIFVEKILIR